MIPAPIIVISGLPGVGKSTTARAVARRFERSAHVEADLLQGLIVSGRAEGGVEGISPAAWSQIDLRLRNACLLARSFAESGFTAVVDDIVVGSRLDDLEQNLAGYRYLFVMLAPPFEQVRRRWLAAGSPFADSWGWIDEDMRVRTRRVGLWLDTTDLEPDQVADAIVDELEAGGKVRP